MARRQSHVYQVLAQPRLVAGVEYPLFMANLGIGLIFVLALKFYWWIPAIYLLHKILQVAAKNDPAMRVIFVTYSHHGDHYEPWVSDTTLRNRRPKDFGRGVNW